ncbi:unnamed protein product [Bursaphelenchus okinawaensis]|uniref:Nuclear pore complex protein n=1 Tax=Bursaphelenchus okinawaensis TaxID=465554 RepID=A0A811JQP9_9BILA|nr:unnamed protein product [Bursaphelenchus okinawaensis]CAG9078147.1 unnamed protein product [Bursaphelenchus okinawaensis]
MDTSQADIQAHFLEDEDAVIRVSTAVFEDFHQTFSNDEYTLSQMLNECKQTLQSGVTALRQIATGVRHKSGQLTKTAGLLAFEHDIIKLLCDSDDMDKQLDNSSELPSQLHKILKKDREFRSIYNLMKWCEYRSSDCPKGFTAILGGAVDINIEKIRADLRSWTATNDLDLIFSDSNRLRGQFEQSAVLLYQLMVAFVRSGRIALAVEEAEKAGCHNLAAILDSRSIFYELELSTDDPTDENYGFIEARKAMKLTAQSLLSNTEKSTREEQRLLWSILAVDQREMIARANNYEDSLWVLLNCALEKIFEQKTDKEFSVELNKHQNVKFETVKQIFEALIGEEQGSASQADVEFKIIAYVAMEDNEKLSAVLRQELIKDLEMHTVRFYAHLVLLMLAKEKKLHQDVIDTVLLKFVDVLAQLGLINLCPFYLAYCTRKLAEERFMKLLKTIQNDEERQAILARAEVYQFVPRSLCTAIYRRAKQSLLSTKDSTLDQDLLEASRAWHWLKLCKELTIESLMEANFLYRKMFAKGRRAAATDLFQTLPADLAEDAEKCFREREGAVEDEALPLDLIQAQQEYIGYQRYFQVAELFNQWDQTSRKTAPSLPAEIPEDKWARLDLRRRTEYEITVNEARQSRERYDNVLQQQKNGVISLAEELLRQADKWLWMDDEDAIEELEEDALRERRQRNEDIKKIRSKYLVEVVEALIKVHRTSKDEMAVLNVARIIVDPTYDIFMLFSKHDLRKLLQSISKSGAALL